MKVIASNRKAHHDYEIIKKYEAGISLLGSEVKSIRNNSINLTGSFVVIRNNLEAEIINLDIPEYKQQAHYFKHDVYRSKKLLLHKKQIRKINQIVKEQKLVIVPLKVYWENSWVKVEIGLAKPLKKYDKREKEKERAIKKKLW